MSSEPVIFQRVVRKFQNPHMLRNNIYLPNV